jgi:hypothetical protein
MIQIANCFSGHTSSALLIVSSIWPAIPEHGVGEAMEVRCRGDDGDALNKAYIEVEPLVNFF